MVAQLATVAPDGSAQQVGYIPIEQIRNDVPQVRRDWRHDNGNERLDDLTQSIRNHGLLQPIEVTPVGDGTYQVLVGYRRLTASRRAGLSHLPAVVRTATEQERSILQLVENIQRQDLAFLDQAHAMQDLMDRFPSSVTALAARLGVSKSYVSLRLRVLGDTTLREAIADGRIAPRSAQLLTQLDERYQESIRQRLRGGEKIGYPDVTQASRQQQSDGVIKQTTASPGAMNPALHETRLAALDLYESGVHYAEIGRRLGIKSHVTVYQYIAQARRLRESPELNNVTSKEWREAARDLRAQGRSAHTIAATVGVSLAAVQYYFTRLDAEEEAQAAQPKVTLNGVSLDPFIATVHERQDDRETENQPTPPHKRPLRSPLPWENQDAPRVRYSVDPAGLVIPEPQPQAPASHPATVPPASAPQQPQRGPVPLAAVDDPDVTRLRFMLSGAEQPCRDLLTAMLGLGREKGWTCQELWRKMEQAASTR